MNWTKTILTSSIITLFSAIVLLIVLLIPVPEYEEPRLTFNEVIELTINRINDVERALMEFDVTVIDETGYIHNGTMIYVNNVKQSREVMSLSPEVEQFRGTALIPTPMQAVNAIQINVQGNFANDLNPVLRPCHSTFSTPVNLTAKTYAINGSVIYMTCLDVETGYPTIILVNDFNTTNQVTSKIFLKSMEFTKKT